MEMTGSTRIGAPRGRVWEALNDPLVLKDCIPGCESLEKLSDTELQAAVRAKIGPVNARFTGRVLLSDIVPPESCTMSGEGTGGAAGFAKGGADVRLEEDGAETVLSYAARAQVGGKLAQIGSRLVDGVARKMADEFFAKFAARVGAPPTAPIDEAADDDEIGPAEIPGAPGPTLTPDHHVEIPAAPATHPPEPPSVPSAAALGALWNARGGMLLLGAVAIVIVLFLIAG